MYKKTIVFGGCDCLDELVTFKFTSRDAYEFPGEMTNSHVPGLMLAQEDALVDALPVGVEMSVTSGLAGGLSEIEDMRPAEPEIDSNVTTPALIVSPSVTPEVLNLVHVALEEGKAVVATRGMPKTKIMRSALSVVMAGSGISLNGVRISHMKELHEVLMPLALANLGFHFVLPREYIVLVLAMHMAEGVRDETLLELNLGILVTIRQNPNALGEVAAAAMDLFTHVRPGRSGISKGFHPGRGLKELGLLTGRHWIGTNLSSELRARLLTMFDAHTGRAL